jgi:hypothetical protein
LEFDPQFLVEDTQGAVTIAHNGFWHEGLHFLRHHADISLVTAVVAEAIVAKSIREMTEKNNIVFERNVGSASATASATTASTTATTTAEATAATPAAKARPSAGALQAGASAAADACEGGPTAASTS